MACRASAMATVVLTEGAAALRRQVSGGMRNYCRRYCVKKNDAIHMIELNNIYYRAATAAAAGAAAASYTT